MIKLYTDKVAKEKKKEWEDNMVKHVVRPFHVEVSENSLYNLKHRYKKYRNDKKEIIKDTIKWMY